MVKNKKILKISIQVLCFFFYILSHSSFFAQTSEKFKAVGFAYNPEEKDGLQESALEWWYHSGFFKTKDTTEYEYSFVSSFQRTLLGKYMFFAITDLRTGEVSYQALLDKTVTFNLPLLIKGHRYIRSANQSCNAPRSPLWLCYENNFLQKIDSVYHLNLVKDKIIFSVAMKKTGPPMPIMGTGMMGYEEPEDVYYYSYPWLILNGTFTNRDTTLQIKGEAWYDHQWLKLKPHIVKWGWWGLKFNNNMAMNIYFLQNAITGNILQTTLTLTHKNGNTEVYRNIKFTPLKTWRKNLLHRKYPVEWKIEIPEKKLVIRITPFVENEELPVLGIGWIWEGPCKATATLGNDTIHGIGFQELMGKLGNKIIETTAQ